MVNKIKFSHNYPKLWGQFEAKLMDVKVISQSGGLPPELIEYDTKTNKGDYYELPKGDLLYLLFVGNFLIPFCTIRRHTDQKEQYYREQIGTVFVIEVEGVETK